MTQNKPLFHPFFWIDWISNCKEELTLSITSSPNGPTGGSGLEKKCDLWLLIIKNVSSTRAEVLALSFYKILMKELYYVESRVYLDFLHRLSPQLTLVSEWWTQNPSKPKGKRDVKKGTNNQQITYQLWIQSSISNRLKWTIPCSK